MSLKERGEVRGEEEREEEEVLDKPVASSEEGGAFGKRAVEFRTTGEQLRACTCGEVEQGGGGGEQVSTGGAGAAGGGGGGSCVKGR